MSVTDRVARYRLKKEAQGDQQVLIWVQRDLRERLDEAVRAGGYKNRSEIVAQAVSKFLEEQRN